MDDSDAWFVHDDPVIVLESENARSSSSVE